jgi:uncharacterized protein (TIGR04255 family)
MIDYTKVADWLATKPTLLNPPVEEAILAFHFTGELPDNTLQILEQLYPEWKWNKQRHFIANLNLNSPEQSDNKIWDLQQGEDNMHKHFVGRNAFKVNSIQPTEIEQNLILSLTKNELTFSLSRPYNNWEAFIEQALKYFKNISNAFSLELTSYGVRFINGFDFNLTLKEYLREGFLPDEGIVNLNHMVYNRVTQHLVIGSPFIATIQLTFLTQNISSEISKGGMRMDIALQAYENAPNLADNAKLAELRLLKNYFFFNTLNDNVLALCNQ